MATVDKLIVRIEADLKNLKQGLKQSEIATKNSTAKMKDSFSKVGNSIRGLGRTLFSLKGALIGLGVGAGIRSLIKVGSEVESLQIRFETIFKSATEGAKAFDVMAKFASKVPFSLQAIQAGAGSLLAIAKDAEELGELMEMTGTIAAATGLDFRTASEQIQRSLSAGIGAADLFRDRGVTAMMGFTAGTQVSVEETKVALEKFAKDNDGVMEKLANSYQGTLSMIGDAIFSFQRAINDAGFFASLTKHFSDLKNSIDNNKDSLQEFAKRISGVLVGAMQGLRDILTFVVEKWDFLVIAIKAYIALKVALVIGNLVVGLVLLGKQLKVATAAQWLFNTAVWKNPYVIGGAVLFTAIAFVKDLAHAIGGVKEEQEKLNKAVKTGIQIFAEQYGEKSAQLIKDRIRALEREASLYNQEFDLESMVPSEEDMKKQREFMKERNKLLEELKVIQTELSNIKEGKVFNAKVLMGITGNVGLLNKALTEEIDIFAQLEEASKKFNEPLITKGKEALKEINKLTDALSMNREELMFLKETSEMNADALRVNGPLIREAIKNYFEMKDATEAQTTAQEESTKALEVYNDAMQDLVAEQKILQHILNEVAEKGYSTLDDAMMQAIEWGMKQEQVTKEQVKAMAEQIRAVNELKEALERLPDREGKGWMTDLEAAGARVGRGPTKTDRESDPLDKFINPTGPNVGEAELEALREQKALLLELGVIKEDYYDQFLLLDEALANSTITQQQYNEAIAALNIKLMEADPVIRVFMDGIDQAMTSLSETMADSLMQMGEGWKGFRDSLKKIARDIIAQLIKIMIQALITKAITAAVGGGFGDGGSVGPSKVGTSGYGVKQAAYGAGVTGQQPVLVGEKGPELFVPHTSGGIFTNASSKKLGGGGTNITQVINIETGVSQTVRAEMLSLLPQLKQESVNAVMDAKKRGGQMADTFS